MAKVLVGMSGGVDSAVTAYLLKQEGHEVTGVTLRTWQEEDGGDSRCCEIDEARRTCEVLGIKYHPHNCLSLFDNCVVKPFVDDYLKGLTPNPCIECNRYVKWAKMLELAQVFGAEYIATGHYASIVALPNGRFTVRKSPHANKDQSYMIYKLTQEQLAHTLMPLGGYTKDEVRAIAEKAGIPCAHKDDSQEICFVTDGRYTDFIREHSDRPVPEEGEFVDEDGRVLGIHKGIYQYTVGQRKGLGIALGYPAYVTKILADENKVVLGSLEALKAREVICRDVNFMSIEDIKDGEKINCFAKTRYHQTERPAVVERLDPEHIKITASEPFPGVSPGQSAVFYDEDGCIIGGGVIERSL